MKKKSKIGGARPGAGRKPNPLLGPKIDRTISQYAIVWEFVDSLAEQENGNVSAAVDKFVRNSKPFKVWEKQHVDA